MTGQIHRRNEKILRNIAFTNFDFLELSEIYIHSGELTPREIAFIRERAQEMMEARLLCDDSSIPALKKAAEERIRKFFGEARYKRLKSDMELHYLEYCDRYLESTESTCFSKASLLERVSICIKKFIERLTNRK